MTTNFEQVMDQYLRYLHQTHCFERYSLSKRVLLGFHQDTQVKTLDEADGHLIFQWITGHKWSPHTMRNALSVFRGMIRYAGLDRLSLSSRLPRSPYKKPTIITAEQHAALVGAASPELANVLSVLWATLMCPGEIVSAHTDQISFKGDGLMIVQERSLLPNRSRAIYVPPKTSKLIRTLTAANGDGPIFRRAKGQAWTLDSLRNSFFRLCQRMELSGVSLKVYRNAAMKRLTMEGVDSDTIARLLGHTSLSGEFFVKPNESRLWAAVKILEAEAP